MKNQIELLLVNPGNRTSIYQSLAGELTAIEPPLWAGLLASYAEREGIPVAILDGEAEELAPEQVAERVAQIAPRLTCVIAYGHQPSASTQNMTAAGLLCRRLKERETARPIILLGGHVSALPERTMAEEVADFVCEGEGPYTLKALLAELESPAPDFTKVPGLWWREHTAVRHTPRAPVVADLDRELPGSAWHLLPMQRYRAHNWHCFGRLESRSPYASIYTSLGCPFRCTFCCINAPFGKPAYRMRSPESVVGELELLNTRYGVQNIKITDEMFVLNNTHVLGICERIIQRGLPLNIWAYARIDTVKPHILETLKRAGVNWLALGIESGSEHVRDGAEKSFGKHDIKQVVRQIQQAGINVIGNFIFGLPDDTQQTMEETLELALELNCEMANFYSAMAYPGSPLYTLAVSQGWPLPESWQGFSQHAVDTLPLPTKHLKAHEVLNFRDEAFVRYFSNPAYLEMVGEKFGSGTARHVEEMSRRRLDRKYATSSPSATLTRLR